MIYSFVGLNLRRTRLLAKEVPPRTVDERMRCIVGDDTNREHVLSPAYVTLAIRSRQKYILTNGTIEQLCRPTAVHFKSTSSITASYTYVPSLYAFQEPVWTF